MVILVTMWNWVGENASIIVATLAFVATGFQAHFARQHNRVSVRPHLSTTASYERRPEGVRFFATLQNNGLGPAFIKSFEIVVDNVPHKVVESSEISALVTGQFGVPLQTGKFFVARKGAVMKAGAEFPVADCVVPIPLGTSLESMVAKLQSFQLRVVHTSAYGEKFTYDSRMHRE